MSIELARLFAAVIACERCAAGATSRLLRDNGENVPQPGFVGSNYEAKRILLAGQNPAVPGVALMERDKTYTAALRLVRADATAANYFLLHDVLGDFVPTWPVHGRYFPLDEAGLGLQDIAYCNVVRCRTVGNATPAPKLAATCVEAHFVAWLDALRPRAVVFIGMWAYQQAQAEVQRRGIPCDFMNRSRSLPTAERAANRARVVKFLKTLDG